MTGHLRILLVEDVAVVRVDFAAQLRDRGHEVVEARCGAEGLAWMRGGAYFDVLLLDLVMPNMDGIEMLKIAKTEGLKLPLVIAVTAYDQLTPAVTQLAKVIGVIKKPLETDLLAEHVETLVGNSIHP